MGKLTNSEIDARLESIEGWQAVEHHHLRKTWEFDDFQSALDFVNEVGKIAEARNHHPDICLGWGRVEIEIFTHSEGGITQNDFTLAGEIDRL